MNHKDAQPMQRTTPSTLTSATPGYPPASAKQSGLLRFVPWIAAGLAILAMAMAVAKAMRPVVITDGVEGAGGVAGVGGLPIDDIARLPVSASGRTKPLDSFARSSLLRLSGRQTFEVNPGSGERAKRAPAIQWLMEVWTAPTKAMDRRVIRIDHPDVLALLGLSDQKRTRFSLNEVLPKLREISKQAEAASGKSAKSRDPFERHIVDLYSKLVEFSSLANLDAPYLAAPLAPGEEWRPLFQSVDSQSEGRSVRAWKEILSTYAEGVGTSGGDAQSGDAGDQAAGAAKCREATEAYAGELAWALPSDTKAARSEVIFNRVQPFYQASVLYVVAFLLGAVALLLRPLSHGASSVGVPGANSAGEAGNAGWSLALVRAALGVVAVAFVAHSLGLVARIWLQGRPPVTNLYSSAVFIGWACVPVALVGEWFQRLGLLTLAASMIGFSTLVIAHNLGSSGDTMEMMQAVLDSNFWLATHVVVVTIGYSATFLAGFLAVMYVLLGIPTRLLAGEPVKALPKMTYGVICFATIASFVGTVLGGIWADQSWGRFWGWDPKENGAAMIVLWNLLILHARWGGLIKERGVAVLAIAGNIITAWSWFGTNMLGVGLHSYGFMDSAAFYLILFCLSQLAIMGLALAVPKEKWRSAVVVGGKSTIAQGTVAMGTLAPACATPSGPIASASRAN